MSEYFEEKNPRMKNAAMAGIVGFFATGSAVGIGIAAKPEEFINFMSNHLAVIGLGAAALAVIAVMMYAAYKYSQKNEESFDNSTPPARPDRDTIIDEEDEECEDRLRQSASFPCS